MKCTRLFKKVKKHVLWAVTACVWLGFSDFTYAAEEKNMVVEMVIVSESDEARQIFLEESNIAETITPMNASTVSDTWGKLNWSLAEGTLTITGSGEIIPPSGWSGYPWGAYTQEITKVVIGDYVTNIPSNAFGSMSNLTTVTIGNRVTSIGEGAFQRCEKLETVWLGDSIRTIEASAFLMCSQLSSVRFGSKVKTIGKQAFFSCEQLETVTLPDSIRTIGDEAFYRCMSLTSLSIPYGIKEIGEQAFYYCVKLRGEIKIPGTVTSLGKEGFIRCESLEGVSVYAACAIPEYMFKGCKSLESVTIGATVTGIENRAFDGCSALKEITVSKGITAIGEYAFCDCSALSKITLPTTLKSVGTCAFGLTAITSFKIPDTVKEMGQGVFAGCKELKTVTFGSGLTSVPLGTFSQCEALESVTLNNSITNIEEGSFLKCGSLKSISLPPNVTNIGERAFYECTSLAAIEIPSSVKSIGANAFAKCSALSTYKTLCMDTQYADNTVFSDTSVTLYGPAGSTTQTYAKNNNIPFVEIKVLAAPTKKKIINVVSGPHVYWNPVKGATYYTLYRATSKSGIYSILKEKVTATHYIDTTAVSGKTYYYKVMAKDGSTKSALSAPQSITYVGTPDITSRVNTKAGIKLGWNKITGATGYAIYRKSYAGTDAWVRVATISGNSTFTWTDGTVKAKNGSVYKYTVRALAGSNKNILSGCRTTGRTMVRLASRTLNSAKKATTNSIKCSWTTSDKVTGYEMRFMDGDKVVKMETVGNYKTGVKSFNGLAKGKNYKVQVRSYKKVNGVGSFYSAWSVAKYVQL